MERLRKWLADRRWRREQPAREAWVTLYDSQGRPIHTSPTILAPTSSGVLQNEVPVVFGPIAGNATVTHLVYRDSDGVEHTLPLKP